MNPAAERNVEFSKDRVVFQSDHPLPCRGLHLLGKVVRTQLSWPKPIGSPGLRTRSDSGSWRRGAPVVPVECATPNDGEKGRNRNKKSMEGAFIKVDTHGYPVPSGPDEGLTACSDSLDDPASGHKLVTNIKPCRSQCKPPEV